MIKVLLGGVVILFMVVFALGALTGRVRVESCCNMSDADPELRTQSPEASGSGAETA